MARTIRDSKTDTPTARGKLAPDPEPYWVPLAPGLALGYHKPKKGAGTWRARVYLPDSRTLKRMVLGQADDGKDAADNDRILTYAQAQIKAGEWAQEVLAGVKREAGGEVLPKGALTVNAALDQYFEAGERRGVKGIKSDIIRANAWIRPELGRIEVDILSRERIEKWLDAMAKAPRIIRKPAPLAPGAHVPKPRNFKVPRPPKVKPEPPAPPSTPEEKRKRKDSANRVLTILKAALNDALDRKKVKCSGTAWRSVKPYPEVSQARVRFLSTEEQVRLVNACEGEFQILVKCALLTGARYSELTRILVTDFNATAGTVFIAESKSGKERHVHLNEDGVNLFTELCAGLGADAHVFTRGEGVVRRSRVDLGDKWGDGDQRREMAEACKRSEIKLLTFHELRHSYASMLVNRGMPLAFVAKQLGHASTVMVEKHYGHLAPSALADSVRALMPNLGFSEGKVETLKLG